jgi:hypothetical protein
MEKITLIRGSFKDENREAKKLLEESNIEFRQIYSSSTYDSPVLITNVSAFPYKGVASIKAYCDIFKQSS